ncbi:MAG TPA: 3-phosphoshikimate 1-carboxyvinyltransferase [Blastocatellia bacterium]|nr:3-phosphoshikimate 1-carboxyvinyltransferase [Blastocatellia bacterium]
MSRSIRIKGLAPLNGIVSVPGDKSISHRVAMLASIASGRCEIRGFATSADCRSTLDCIKRLGVKVEEIDGRLVIHGAGLGGYQAQGGRVSLDAGNSGSTIRMLSGLLAAQPFTSVIDGDASLRRRPMRRIIEPLNLMGCGIDARQSRFPPLTIHGSPLAAIDYISPVASAQVKTCVLFAGLLASGRTTFREPAPSRNHTELMLAEFGARFDKSESDNSMSVEGGAELQPIEYRVPGDLSSASFFIAAATMLNDSKLVIRNVNLNPTRTAFINVLNGLGANVLVENLTVRHNEPVGDISVKSAALKSYKHGLIASAEAIPNLIDEIPILAVVGSQVEGRLEVRDARELRVKESDRIRSVVAAIKSLGGEIEEFEDGFAIEGPQRLRGATVESAGDHRIAMAFTIAGLVAEGTTEILDADCAAVSFPEFYELLASITPGGTLLRS